MRNYIENYQFYYVNDVIDFSNITGEIDEIVVEYITKRLSEVKTETSQAIDFLSESFDDIEEQMFKWKTSYLEKIQNIKNTSSFIAMKNISSEESGFYALSEIDYDQSKNVSFSKVENGIVMASIHELYVGSKA
jgi:6-pyruvoyl-tetrahydropterin synthase